MQWLLWLPSVGSRAHRLQSLWCMDLVPHGMWNLPRPEIKTVSPALVGRFLNTGPPGKSLTDFKAKEFAQKLDCILKGSNPLVRPV